MKQLSKCVTVKTFLTAIGACNKFYHFSFIHTFLILKIVKLIFVINYLNYNCHLTFFFMSPSLPGRYIYYHALYYQPLSSISTSQLAVFCIPFILLFVKRCRLEISCIFNLFCACNFFPQVVKSQIFKSSETKMSSNEFYLRYYVGHKGKFGHEFLEFEFRPDGTYLDIFLFFKTNHLNLCFRIILN